MRKGWKITLITLGSLLGLVVLVTGGYVVYVASTYHRIGNIPLSYHGVTWKGKVEIDKELTLTTFNIGFGAYSPDYTFFMDEGYDKDGNKTKGTHGKGISYEDVKKNTDGAIKTAWDLKSDFYCFQEVDLDSDRSYHINQRKAIEDQFLDFYDATYALNFDTAFLAYPFNDMHGKSKAGLETLSSYTVKEAERREYTISDGFSKYFDLDRCFSVHRIDVDNGKELVLINSHMSAYDSGGTIRAKQVNELYSYMKAEEDKGNYVLTCGDFNHDLLTGNPDYSYTRDNFAYMNQIDQKKPDWLSYMFDENGKSDFDNGFHIYAADNNPSCRDCDVVWTPGSTFVSTVDGFIASPNIKVSKVETHKVGENGFAYSDHQPSTLTFKLEA